MPENGSYAKLILSGTPPPVLGTELPILNVVSSDYWDMCGSFNGRLGQNLRTRTQHNLTKDSIDCADDLSAAME